jgi:GxxExxY protein
MKPKDITPAIIGAALKVHRALGPGLLESAYVEELEHELRKLGLCVEQEGSVPVIEDGVQQERGLRGELLVERQVMVECKVKDKLDPSDESQLISHLRLFKLQAGLLINFQELNLRNGIRQIGNEFPK